jgi:transposase
MIHPLPALNPETIAFDLSSIPTYGQECSLIEPGSKTHETHLNQINLSVITSYFDSYPISHFVHPGSFHSITTIPDLIIRLKELMVIPGTIVWDRGYTTEEQINRIEKEGWKLICGVTKRTNEAKNIVFQTEPPLDPDHLVPTQCMNIYAEKVDTPLFGNEGSVVVYLNVERQLREMKSRHCNLLQIQNNLAELQNSCTGMDTNVVSENIAKVVPKLYEKFFKIEISKDKKGIKIEWAADNEARIKAERMDGKYLLYASDPSLSATEVVRMYFERDFVEKVFRDLKTFEEIAPIRHRKESRVLGIMFVCTLALRLKIALRAMLETVEEKNVSVEVLLKQMSRVHRVVLQKDTEVEIWYTGLQEKQKKILKKIGMKDLFGDRVR